MIVVTGATGHLGRLVIERLLEKLPPSEIAALARDPERAKDLTARGITIHQANYSQPESLASIFKPGDKVLLISSSEVGQRIPQHKAVIDAAKSAGASLLAYTSLLHADTTPLALSPEHKATEEYLLASGIPYVLLRNGWYFENHTASLGAALAHGVILGAAGNGRFAAAARADYAAAAATVLTNPGHENKIYELGGDAPYTLAELAAEVSRQSGKQVVYQNLSEPEYAKALTGFGLPAPLAEILADADAWAAKGELDDTSHDLSTLISRQTAPLSEAVKSALAS